MNQEKALQILRSGNNVFLTGPAGTGKTYILNKFIEDLKDKGANVAITASTGIAATHINGRTIHSWANFGIHKSLTSKELNKIKRNPRTRERVKNTDILIIDEISMLHDFQIDMADLICRTIRSDARPFGGIQVILCGDFFQLPPVDKERSSGDFITRSRIWPDLNLKVCYLTEQFRQKDNSLNDLLLGIRSGDINDSHLELLASRISAKKERAEDITKLFTHNANVDAINSHKLGNLPEKEHIYQMTSEGEDHLVNFLKKNCLAPETLRLKKDAIVMFVKNNFDQGYVNGTIGKIVGFNNDSYPIVRVKSGKKITAVPTRWVVEENDTVIASIHQIPLRLAWAITVHKSQGMTLDAAEVDLSRAFTFGLGYVALSRVRSLKNLNLLGINDLALMVSNEAKKMDKDFEKASEEAEKEDYEERMFQLIVDKEASLAEKIMGKIAGKSKARKSKQKTVKKNKTIRQKGN